MAEKVETWGDDDTAIYLRHAEAFVPRRREQIGTFLELVGGMEVRAALELGCGDGIITEALIASREIASITLLDSSDRMLSAARARLSGTSEKVEYREDTLEDALLGTSKFDLVYSFLAIHHLTDMRKRDLYTRVFSALRDGGLFVLGDLVEPIGKTNRRVAGADWSRAVMRSSEESEEQAGAYELFTSSGWNHYQIPVPDPVDKPSSVRDNLAWLSGAGFSDVDICWLYGGHAIFGCEKSRGNDNNVD